MGARVRAFLTVLLLATTALAGCAAPEDAPTPATVQPGVQEDAELRIDRVDGLTVTLTLVLPENATEERVLWRFGSHLDAREGNLTESHTYERPGRYTVEATAGEYTGTRVVTVEGSTDEDGQNATTPPDDDAQPDDPIPPRSGTLKPYVVIAVIDTGINPYHEAFRRPGLTAHPGTYLPDYPASAKPLLLTLDDAYNADADRDRFLEVERGGKDLRWVPGTNIVGAVSFGEYVDPLAGAEATRPILDEHGHGTHSAGVAAGRGYSAAPETTLLVVVEVGPGQFEQGIRWAAEQPWIDALSISLGTRANVGAPGSIGQGAADATRLAAANGKLVFVASGNGVTNTGVAGDRCTTYTSGYTGPAWVTRVGAAVDDTGESQSWHCIPVDLIAEEYQATAAHTSADGSARAGGTSGATPTAAGYAALVLSRVRAAYGDPTAGPDEGLLVRGPGGDLDRDAFLHALYRAAEPVATQAPSTPRAEPTHPASFATQGWGFLGPDAAERAVAALANGDALPDRPEAEAFFAADHDIRVQLWGSPP